MGLIPVLIKADRKDLLDRPDIIFGFHFLRGPVSQNCGPSGRLGVEREHIRHRIRQVILRNSRELVHKWVVYLGPAIGFSISQTRIYAHGIPLWLQS
jgi:hypothetical protein